MNEKKISGFRNIIKLKDMVSVSVRKKWVFIGFFLVVLIIGLLFTFIKTPVYQSYSALRLKDIYYEENLYKYFPEEARALGIFAPGMEIEELESEILNGITKDIRDDVLLDDVSAKLDFEINKDKLNEAISTLIDRGNKVIAITATYSNAEGSYKINNILINTYLENSRNEKSQIIEDSILKINGRVTALEQQFEDAESQNEGAEDIESELDSINNLIIDLNEIKYNLENNKEVYINNVEISEEPVIPVDAINIDNFKSILITVFAAIAVGLIAVYIPNVFAPFKK
ncbi:MAG TPA: Wzz/FepE/Etk N-terminal domain-containing protein [Candidatus Humimicrobiaceae bacterium]